MRDRDLNSKETLPAWQANFGEEIHYLVFRNSVLLPGAILRGGLLFRMEATVRIRKHETMTIQGPREQPSAMTAWVIAAREAPGAGGVYRRTPEKCKQWGLVCHVCGDGQWANFFGED
jgi:hypothetical protein